MTKDSSTITFTKGDDVISTKSLKDKDKDKDKYKKKKESSSKSSKKIKLPSIKSSKTNKAPSITSSKKDEIVSTKRDTKDSLKQISVVDLGRKEMVVSKAVAAPKTIYSIILKIFKFVFSGPKYFADFLNTGGKSIFYAIIGTMISFIFALYLFPDQPGVFAVFFTTLFIASFIINETNLNALLVGRTKRVKKDGVTLVKLNVKQEGKFSFIDFYEENKRILSIYFFFFIGIMLVVTALIVFIPIEFSAELFSNQGWTQSLLPSRDFGFSGTNKLMAFKEILINNFSVAVISFIIALVFPLGASLLIVWNAMYWAVSFTQYAIFYSAAFDVTLYRILFPLFLSVGLHTLIEACCYFFAAMSGNLLATGIKKEGFNSDRFFYIFEYSMILLLFSLAFLIIGGIAEVFLFDTLKNFFFSLFNLF